MVSNPEKYGISHFVSLIKELEDVNLGSKGGAEMDQMKIGLFLKELRNERGLTQEQLAEKLNVSNRSVSRWETASTLPDISLMIELADYYEVDIKELLEGERKSEIMNKESKETFNKIAEYSVERTKSQLETFGIFTEILIVIGIIISITLAKFVADNTVQLIVTLICGWFVWSYGIVLRVKIRKELKELTNRQ